MPIYAYRCATCGHAKDVLQKISDPLLTVCPHCGAPTFQKQVTAAGFQLKGSGWYVTDFRDKASPAPATGVKPDESAKPASSDAPKPASDGGSSPSPAPAAPAASSDSKPPSSGSPPSSS